jgi:2-keto-4-pentenoate hydratase
VTNLKAELSSKAIDPNKLVGSKPTAGLQKGKFNSHGLTVRFRHARLQDGVNALILDFNELAARQLRDYRNVNPGTCFANPDFELSIDSAYQLQDAVAGLRLKEGDAVAGYKIGCIGEDIKSQFGIEGPIRGTIFRSEIFSDDLKLSADSFCNLAVEAEMVFTIGDKGQIENTFPVIELHNLIFRAEKKNLSELIANNGIHAGLVMPHNKFINTYQQSERACEISLQINDSIFSTNQVWPIKESPSGSLDWLREHAMSHTFNVSAGNIVLAGTTLEIYPVKTGDKIAVFLDGQAMVTCSVG